MNIISMSVYFVFDTRRTHKNKRQIPHANNAQPIDQTPAKRLPALLSLSSLGYSEWKINENFRRVMKQSVRKGIDKAIVQLLWV